MKRISFLIFAAVSLAGCVTVKPQEHAMLADPTMRFDDDATRQAQALSIEFAALRTPWIVWRTKSCRRWKRAG